MLSWLHNYSYTEFTHELECMKIMKGTPTREEHLLCVDNHALEELIVLDPMARTKYENYSRSYYDVQKHEDAILQYGSQDIPFSSFDADAYNAAIEDTRLALKQIPMARSLDIRTELSDVPFEGTSSAGFGYIGAKGLVNETQHKRAMGIAKALVLNVFDAGQAELDKSIRESTPHIGYTRTQLTDLTEKLKVRGVWGAPFHHILIEGLSASQVLEQVKNSDSFIHLGKDPVYSVPQLIYDIKKSNKLIYCYDWSAFDATQSRHEINTAFDLIKERIIFPTEESELAFEISRQLFIHKKVIAPSGMMYFSHRGGPSGSYWTTLINSIINRLRIAYLWKKLRDTIPDVIHTHGDDSLTGSDLLVDLVELSTEATKTGWTLNASKSIYTVTPEEVEFLGRTVRGGSSIRTIDRCIKLLIFPEYPQNDPMISSYRAQALSDDVGGHSRLLIDVARSLHRKYGTTPHEEVPKRLQIYSIK